MINIIPKIKIPVTPTCRFCKQKIFCFKDKLSIKEYRISGLCQKCQDRTFQGGEE